MRRTVRSSTVFLLAVGLGLTSTTAIAQDDESPTFASEDGLLAVQVPADAATADTSIRVVTREPGERPDELAALPMSDAFYELQPLDARFAEPVRVTRLIEFARFGIDSFDPARDALAVASLFTRDSDGVWSWLDAQAVSVDVDRGAFVVHGLTDHGGPLLTAIGSDLIVAADPPESSVGEGFRVEGVVRVDPPSAATIGATSGRTSDPAVAAPLGSYDVEGIDGAIGLEFECLAPGTVDYEVIFTLTDVADVDVLDEAIGLGGTSVDVAYAGEQACS